jgi:hypothetical protein
MNLANQRVSELEHQKQGLLREFEYWRESSKPGGPLEKHHTQIRRITARLEGLLGLIEIKQPQGDFEANEDAFRRLLGAQRIWDFFRSKLGMRAVTWLRDDLMCADEFAWECYRPARDRAIRAGTISLEAVKEPPLIFFTGDASPFAQARDTLFAPQGIKERDILDLGEATLNLPIPIIGIPWSQLRHMPSAVVIGHEVGHAVEHDLQLEPVVQSLINNLRIPDNRKEAWLAWRHEIFADVYGVLCSGPAAVLALISYLVTEERSIQEEQVSSRNWGTYPSRYLRMNLNFELLRQLGLLETSREVLKNFGLAESSLDKAWNDTYIFHQMSHFDEDVPAILSALLNGPYPPLGSVGLTEIITFRPRDLEIVKERVSKVIFGKQEPAEGDRMRFLFTATTLAYHSDPGKYAASDHTWSLGPRFRKAISLGVRSGTGTRSEQEIRALEEADRGAGASLLNFFKTTSAP